MVPAMPAIRICIAVSLALCFAAGPARAQFWGNNWGNGWHGGWHSPHHRVRPSAPKPPAQASASPQEPAAQDTPAPYDRDLQRLSEILGALHFLRGVCNSGEGEKWRSEAKALIDAEAPSGNRREHMVASFNRGYTGFGSYRSCTPAADLVIRRYMEEGATIARDITARYAN